MARPRNIAKIIGDLKLTEAEKVVVRDLLKVDPRVAKLQERRAALLEQVEALDAEIAGATDGKAQKARGKRRGRKPGRKPGRPAGKMAKRMGRPAKTAKVAPKVKKKRTPAEQAAINARMAKARAARGKAKG